MTRRAFFTQITVIATQSALVPRIGAIEPNAGTPEGFVLTGHLTNAGQEGERYYAIAQTVSIMLDARKHPAMVAGADALLDQEVRVTLMRA